MNWNKISLFFETLFKFWLAVSFLSILAVLFGGSILGKIMVLILTIGGFMFTIRGLNDDK